MAAPDPLMVIGMRDGRLSRQVFFKMTHPMGTVYAWDGIGAFVLDGAEYVGCGNLIEINAISASHDLQEPDIDVTFNAVPHAALQAAGAGVRGQTAQIIAAWLDIETGAVVHSRVMFSGFARQMRVTPDEDKLSIRVSCRGGFYGWNVAPNVYYTPQDQDRLFGAGVDTGMRFIKSLVNASLAGWSVNAEASGGVPIAHYQTTGSDYKDFAFDDLTGEIIGHHTFGASFFTQGTAVPRPIWALHTSFTLSNMDRIEEDVTGAQAFSGAFGEPITVGGVNCYVDESGDVRTAGGELLVAGGAGASYRLRTQGAIASEGAATADTVGTWTPSGNGLPNFSTAFAKPIVTGSAPSGDDFTGIVYDNRRGANPKVTGSSITDLNGAAAYAEAGTGDAVTYSGGVLQCHGADCVVSDTGAIITDAGNFIVWQDASATAENFLRIWT